MKSKSNSNSSLSINLSELFKKKIKKGNQKEKNKANIKNKCPFMRRPVNGVCSNGTILRLNAHGNECCYKK
jgi:hypothetical protein